MAIQSILLVTAGILLSLYSIFQIVDILGTVYWGYIKRPWTVLFFLVLLFLVGLGFYEAALLAGAPPFIGDAILSAGIFYVSVLIMLAIRAASRAVGDTKTVEYNITPGVTTIQAAPPDTDKLQRDLETKTDDLGKLLAELNELKDALVGVKSGKPEMARLKKIIDRLDEGKK